MKKLMILALLSIMLLSGCVSSGDEPIPLANKVIKAESTDSSYYQLVYYDENGREVKYEGYDDNGDLDWYGIISYDDEGKIISWIDYDTNGLIFSRSEYIYDSNGNKIKELCFDENGNLGANIKFVYDENKVTEIWCDQHWNPTGNYYIEYYENNHVIRKETYNRNGDILEEYEITQYDKNGVKTETKEYDASGKLVAVTKYTSVKEPTKNKKVEIEKKKETVADTKSASSKGEPCIYCGDTPSKAYNAKGHKSYVCDECSSECFFCGDKATKKYVSVDGEMSFACAECFNSMHED